MKWMLEPRFEKFTNPIHHSQPVSLIGSCFTENIGKHLSDLFFTTQANPTGILFDPLSIARHVNYWMSAQTINPEELLFANELYQHPDFHSDFSDTNPDICLEKINLAISEAHGFLTRSHYLVVTLGSAFAYRLRKDEQWVANCHKFPAGDFDKVLLETEDIVSALSGSFEGLKEQFPDLRIIVTISPVRHIRDGVIANNHSKARLIEAVHRLCQRFSFLYYFPAYEWMLDVLRDYRWFDIDLVHPNYAATQSVFDLFCELCVDDWTRMKLGDLNKIRNGMEHRPRFPDTEAHQSFLRQLEQRKKELRADMPWLRF